MRLKETTSVILIVGTLGPSFATACSEKRGEESKSSLCCEYGRSILRTIGCIIGTFFAISSDDINKIADNLNGKVFDVSRRGYILHGRKESFVVPTTFALAGGCIGGFFGDLLGRLLRLLYFRL